MDKYERASPNESTSSMVSLVMSYRQYVHVVCVCSPTFRFKPFINASFTGVQCYNKYIFMYKYRHSLSYRFRSMFLSHLLYILCHDLSVMRTEPLLIQGLISCKYTYPMKPHTHMILIHPFKNTHHTSNQQRTASKSETTNIARDTYHHGID